MKLTKENIETIDRHFKNKGVGYWDIRLEMIDHVACKMEEKQGSYDFESLFKYTIKDLNWEGDLKDYEQQRLTAIGKTVGKRYFKNIRGFFTNIKTLLLIGLFVMAYYLCFQNFSQKTFRMLSLVLFSAPIVYFTIHYAYTSLKYKKSGYVLYGYFYLTFSIMMSSIFYQLGPNSIIDVSSITRHNIIFFTTIFNVVFTTSGVIVYLESYKKYQNVYKNLISE